MYGSCNDRSIHSHQYTVEVICRGTVNLSVGTVMSLNDLKTHMNRTIIEDLHGKYLNEDIEFFKSKVRVYYYINIEIKSKTIVVFTSFITFLIKFSFSI